MSQSGNFYTLQTLKFVFIFVTKIKRILKCEKYNQAKSSLIMMCGRIYPIRNALCSEFDVDPYYCPMVLIEVKLVWRFNME
jgi:hypothetical protein